MLQLQDEWLWRWSLSPRSKHQEGEPDYRGHGLQWRLIQSCREMAITSESPNFQVSTFIRNILALTELFKNTI